MSLYPKKIVWVAVLLLPLLLHGKGGEAHVDDMAAVFGPSAVSALLSYASAGFLHSLVFVHHLIRTLDGIAD